MTQIVKDFAYLSSVINSNGDWSQEIKRRLSLGRAAIEELWKISRSRDVSLENTAKIIHTLFPNYYVQVWKLDREEGW